MTINISIFDSTINSEIIKTINARELHKFLKNGQRFSDWIKNRISKYEFEGGFSSLLIKVVCRPPSCETLFYPLTPHKYFHNQWHIVDY